MARVTIVPERSPSEPSTFWGAYEPSFCTLEGGHDLAVRELRSFHAASPLNEKILLQFTPLLWGDYQGINGSKFSTYQLVQIPGTTSNEE